MALQLNCQLARRASPVSDTSYGSFQARASRSGPAGVPTPLQRARPETHASVDNRPYLTGHDTSSTGRRPDPGGTRISRHGSRSVLTEARVAPTRPPMPRPRPRWPQQTAGPDRPRAFLLRPHGVATDWPSRRSGWRDDSPGSLDWSPGRHRALYPGSVRSMDSGAVRPVDRQELHGSWSWRIDRTLPGGSLNQATVGPFPREIPFRSVFRSVVA